MMESLRYCTRADAAAAASYTYDAELAAGSDDVLEAAVRRTLAAGQSIGDGFPRWAPRPARHLRDVVDGLMFGDAPIIQPWAYAWRAEQEVYQELGVRISVRAEIPWTAHNWPRVIELTAAFPERQPHDSRVFRLSGEPSAMWLLGAQEIVSAVFACCAAPRRATR